MRLAGWALCATTLVFTGMLSATPVNASLLTQDLASPGDGLITEDAATGQQWLDVTPTIGLSYDAVLASSYVQSLGFHFASASEIARYWADAGGRVGEGFDLHAAATLLIALMGCTSQLVGVPCDGREQDWHVAFYGGPPLPGAPPSALIVDAYGPPSNDGFAVMSLSFATGGADVLHRPDVAAYLVRAIPVPEPPATMVLLVSLAAYEFRRRRRAAADGALLLGATLLAARRMR